MRIVIASSLTLLAGIHAAPLAAQGVPAEAARLCADAKQSPDARVEACTRAIESGLYKDRGLSALYTNRAAIHRRAGSFDRAEEDIAAALRHNPANDIAHTVRGNINFNLRRFDESILDYDRAIKINPQRWDAYIGRALAHYESGNYQLAVNDWTRLLAKQPSANGYTDRANAHYMLGQYEQAVQDYDRALRLEPTHADAGKYRAEALKMLGR